VLLVVEKKAKVGTHCANYPGLEKALPTVKKLGRLPLLLLLPLPVAGGG